MEDGSIPLPMSNIQALDSNMVDFVHFLLEMILVMAANDEYIIASG
jgi:hypothetical protein